MEKIERMENETPVEGDAEYQKLVEQITRQVIENLKTEYDFVPKNPKSGSAAAEAKPPSGEEE